MADLAKKTKRYPTDLTSLRFFSMANDEYLLAVSKESRLAGLAEIGIEDLRDQKIISFSRQNLSYTERYFAEMFAEHDLARNIAYICDDTFASISLVSAGLGIGFAPQWTKDFPNRNFELRKVRGVDFRIGPRFNIVIQRDGHQSGYILRSAGPLQRHLVC